MLLYPKPLDKKKNEDKKDTFKVPAEHTKHWQRVHVSKDHQVHALQKLLAWDTHDPSNSAVVGKNFMTLILSTSDTPFKFVETL